MLKIAITVCVEPIPIRFRHILNSTTSHTAFTGVWVNLFTDLQKLHRVSGLSLFLQMIGLAYLDNGRASSRANAYAILVSANMAEQPVKN